MSVVNLKVLRITYTEQNLALICHYFNSNSSWQVNSLNDAKVVCCPKDERMDRSRKKTTCHGLEDMHETDSETRN